MKNFVSISEARKDAKQVLLQGYEIPAGHWQGTDTLSREIMLEVLNYGFTAPIPQTIGKLEKECSPDLPWADVHFRERISGIPLNPGESYRIWPYNKFSDGNDPYLKDGKFSHSYMERYWSVSEGHGNLNDLIDLLRENIHTRQAYMPIWFPEDTGNRGGERVPCSLGYHFYYRGDALNVNYFIRSCDFYRHFHNDIYLTCRLTQYIMGRLSGSMPNIYFKVGYITMFITHFHLFKNDKYLIRNR